MRLISLNRAVHSALSSPSSPAPSAPPPRPAPKHPLPHPQPPTYQHPSLRYDRYITITLARSG